MEILFSSKDLVPSLTTRKKFRAVWFPSLFALLSLVVTLWIGLHGHEFLSIVGLLVFVFFVIDALNMYSAFMYLTQSTETRVVLRVIYKCRVSMCSRQVAIALYGKMAKLIFADMGYRYYHILPDKTFSGAFFRKSFWTDKINPESWVK